MLKMDFEAYCLLRKVGVHFVVEPVKQYLSGGKGMLKASKVYLGYKSSSLREMFG